MLILDLQNCVETLGVPEVLVNIAGVKGEEDWENLYDVNVVSLFDTLLKHVNPF